MENDSRKQAKEFIDGISKEGQIFTRKAVEDIVYNIFEGIKKSGKNKYHLE